MFPEVYKHTCTFPHTRSERKELLIIGEKALFIIGGEIPGIRISTGKIRIGRRKISTFIKGSQLVLYQTLHYSTVCIFAKNVKLFKIRTSERNSKYKNFSYNPKFQIQMLLFNMSGDIATQTFVPSHKMVI